MERIVDKEIMVAITEDSEGSGVQVVTDGWSLRYSSSDETSVAIASTKGKEIV